MATRRGAVSATDRWPRRARRRLELCLMVAACTGSGSALHAQPPATSLDPLAPGQRVRIELRVGNRITGRFQERTTDTVVLEVIRRPTFQQAVAVREGIPLDSIVHVWIASGTHWRRGAAIGAALGGAYALVLGILYGGGGDSPECRGGCLLGATGAGAAIGSGLGAVIGVFFLRWRLVY